MNRKVLSIVCIILFSLVCLIGCNPMRQEEIQTDTLETCLERLKESSPKELEEHLELEVSDSYRIDADIRITKELESYEVKNVKLSRIVFENLDVILKEWLNYCGKEVSTEVEVMKSGDGLENGENMEVAYVSFGEDGLSWVQVRSVYAIMHTPFSDNYGTWRIEDTYQRQKIGPVHYTGMDVLPEKAVISDTEAIKIKDGLESVFGITYMDEYKMYTYTEERLQKIVENELAYMEKCGYEKDPNLHWDVTEEDEGAVLCFYQGYDGIPLFYDEPSVNQTGASWPVNNYCTVITSKNGVEGLKLMNSYNIGDETESVKILSLGEFIEKHIEARKGVDTTVVSIGLYYLPIYTGEELDFVTKPIWCVEMMRQDEVGDSVVDSVIYDAVTGDEISWN